jgi:hypothetical protein
LILKNVAAKDDIAAEDTLEEARNVINELGLSPAK